MNEARPDASLPLDAHRQARTLLIVIALAIAAGRIATVTSREGDTAFLSANDRSRWCTVAALVEEGTYAIDSQINRRTPRGRRPWYTIDLVRHRGPDGKLHYYSSKPPLLPTLVAGVYAAVHGATGMTLTAQPIYMTRIVLALVNLPLLAIFLAAMWGVLRRTVRHAWTGTFLTAATAFGTLLFPFTWSLNNHLPAAVASAVAMWVYVRFAAARAVTDEAPGEARQGKRWAWWFLAGLSAAFATANELPALSMLVFWAVLVIWLDRRAVLPFALGAAFVAVAFFGTNWLAHRSLRPPYTHRSNGEMVATVTLSPAELPRAKVAASASDERSGIAMPEVAEALRQAGALETGQSVSITPSGRGGRWRVATPDDRLFALLLPGDADSDSTAPVTAELAVWDDWYDYPGSYWRGGRREGIDRGEPSRVTYAVQMLVGHHGLFSLTPLWLLVPWGWWQGLRRRPPWRRWLIAATALASVVCVAFYIARPEIDRNYGGVSIGFRWLLWFAPFWLFACASPIDTLARSACGRRLAIALLALSIFSVAASLITPWQHPWLYRFWAFLGWIAD